MLARRYCGQNSGSHSACRVSTERGFPPPPEPLIIVPSWKKAHDLWRVQKNGEKTIKIVGPRCSYRLVRWFRIRIHYEHDTSLGQGRALPPSLLFKAGTEQGKRECHVPFIEFPHKKESIIAMNVFAGLSGVAVRVAIAPHSFALVVFESHHQVLLVGDVFRDHPRPLVWKALESR